MPITLEDIDLILGFGPDVADCPAHAFSLGPAELPASVPPTCAVATRPEQPAGSPSDTRKRAEQEGDVTGSATPKRRRMTTEEKVRKFLDSGTWNALLPPGESALSAKNTAKVADAAAAMGLPAPAPEPAPAVPADTPRVAAREGVAQGADTATRPPPVPLSKPVYKSIDNLMILAVAAPQHCGQHTTRLTLTSNASFSRTPDPLPPTASAAAPALAELGSPSVPTLGGIDPARRGAAESGGGGMGASLSPAVVLGMPTMWRSHSGTQLSCY